MNRVRRALDRIGGREGPEKALPEQPPPDGPKQGGHGDHWGCVLRAGEQDELLGFIAEVINNAERPEMFHAAGPGMAVHAPGERLGACVLVVDDKVQTAYPEAHGGPVWPVTISEVVPWANGIEGQITGECYGAQVSFFDTRFYANRRLYKVGETYNFRMAGFAYTLGHAPDAEFESDIGAKISMRGAHAYMPANLGNESADIDDYWFHSPLEAEAGQVMLASKRLNVYSVVVAIPEDFLMQLDLYAAAHVLAPDMASLAVEDDLEGFIWLQGYLDTL